MALIQMLKMRIELDKNYNVLFIGGLLLVSILLIRSISKDKNNEREIETTPISDAINAIKTGKIKTKDIPDVN